MPKDGKTRKVMVRLTPDKHDEFRMWLIRNGNAKAQVVLENLIDGIMAAKTDVSAYTTKRKAVQ